MQKNIIKNLVITGVIFFGISVGFSADCAKNPSFLSENCIDENAKWRLTATPDGSTGKIGEISVTLSACGNDVEIHGKVRCIGLKEKQQSTQMFEMLKIINSVLKLNGSSYVEKLIAGYECCPCPEIQVIETCATSVPSAAIPAKNGCKTPTILEAVLEETSSKSGSCSPLLNVPSFNEDAVRQRLIEALEIKVEELTQKQEERLKSMTRKMLRKISNAAKKQNKVCESDSE